MGLEVRAGGRDTLQVVKCSQYNYFVEWILMKKIYTHLISRLFELCFIHVAHHA